MEVINNSFMLTNFSLFGNYDINVYKKSSHPPYHQCR